MQDARPSYNSPFAPRGLHGPYPAALVCRNREPAPSWELRNALNRAACVNGSTGHWVSDLSPKPRVSGSTPSRVGWPPGHALPLALVGTGSLTIRLAGARVSGTNATGDSMPVIQSSPCSPVRRGAFLLRRMILFCVRPIAIAPLVLLTPYPSGATTFTIHSGNGALFSTDILITMLLGPADRPFSTAFTPTDFAASRSGPGPQITGQDSGLWKAALDVDLKWCPTKMVPPTPKRSRPVT